MSNVELVVEDEPPAGQPLLGLYQGVPLTRRGSGYSGALPDKITIYRGPLERLYGSDPETLRLQVKRVVLHEVAHHFGISDERLVEIDRYWRGGSPGVRLGRDGESVNRSGHGYLDGPTATRPDSIRAEKSSAVNDTGPTAASRTAPSGCDGHAPRDPARSRTSGNGFTIGPDPASRWKA